jgi:hypothetical protein
MLRVMSQAVQSKPATVDCVVSSRRHFLFFHLSLAFFLIKDSFNSKSKYILIEGSLQYGNEDEIFKKVSEKRPTQS